MKIGYDCTYIICTCIEIRNGYLETEYGDVNIEFIWNITGHAATETKYNDGNKENDANDTGYMDKLVRKAGKTCT